MGAFILSLAISIAVGGIVWLLIGSKVRYSEDTVQNDVLNLVTFIGCAVVVSMVFVYAVLG